MPDLDVTCSRCGSKLHHECHPETLQEAAIDLFMWRPESGFPKRLKGNGDGSEKDEAVPFLTESFLYPLLGKEGSWSVGRGVAWKASGMQPTNTPSTPR